MKRKIFIITLILLFDVSMCFPMISDAASDMYNYISYASTARGYEFGWRYKMIGGVLHKRLYNYTTQEWVGEWIKV